MALAMDDIIAGAREKTGGLPNPDCDSWREGLEILLRDHAHADRLTERGLVSVRNRYVDCLAARMAVDDYHRRHPELAATAIKRPVFILGLPRTGTTLTERIVSSHSKAHGAIKKCRAGQCSDGLFTCID